MDNIVVLNQNVKLHSFEKLKDIIKPNSETMILSTQFLFENETGLINSILGCKCIYKSFCDILTDSECELCDRDAFNISKQGNDVSLFYENIQRIKNIRLIEKILSLYSFNHKIITSDGLGIRMEEWIKKDFTHISLDYYYVPTPKQKSFPILRKLLIKPYKFVSHIKRTFSIPIYEAWKDGVKYLFYGNLDRISYRIDLNFHKAGIIEHTKYYLNLFGIIWSNKTIRLSSLHEGYRTIPDKKALNVKLIQDGYLPPNYSSNYLYFYGKNTEFYTWDKIGCNTFKYHHLPHHIMPIRKKIFLPDKFNFPIKVKKVVCAASGTGDWTAVKNRSDDDYLVWTIGKVAAMFPEIEFIYRCHPTWVHPQHAGVNSINRCIEYISWLNLPNFRISSNIPPAIQDGHFVLSYKRSSFEEDLKDVDVVLGEHSVAMLDAGMRGIPFASCNMTGHRAFYEDINNLGFPHCESVEEIAELLKMLPTEEFKENFLKAVNNYNAMTRIE